MQMNTASSMMTSGMSGAAMSSSMPTATAAAATGMGGMASSMDMDMGGGACKISVSDSMNPMINEPGADSRVSRCCGIGIPLTHVSQSG